jgi:hypothetical protein
MIVENTATEQASPAGLFRQATVPVGFDPADPPRTLPGDWVLDHMSRHLWERPTSVYYRRGSSGAGDVMRVSDHWAGDEGIESIDGYDWRLPGSESGTWRAGTADVQELTNRGCLHWTKWAEDVAPREGDSLDMLRQKWESLSGKRRSRDMRVWSKTLKLQGRLEAAAGALVASDPGFADELNRIELAVERLPWSERWSIENARLYAAGIVGAAELGDKKSAKKRVRPGR